MIEGLMQVLTDKVFGEGKVILSGGAVADKYLGLTPKDYDIYVSTALTEFGVMNLLEKLIPELEFVNVRYSGSSGEEAPYLSAVIDYTYKGYLVQIMLCRSEFTDYVTFTNVVAEYFDLEICRGSAYIDFKTGQLTYEYTPVKRGIRNVNLWKRDWGSSRTEKYKNKIKESKVVTN